MGRYFLSRLAQLVPVVLGVAVFTFLILHLIPGDPAQIRAGTDVSEEGVQAIREEYGLDDPLPVQFGSYVWKAVHGDLGTSIHTGETVSRALLDRFVFTIELTSLSIVVAIVLGLTAGVIAATHQNSWLDNAIMVVSLTGLSMPRFWLGLILLQIFAGQLGWFPSGGGGGFDHLVLPAIVLGTSVAASITRMTRAAMLEVIRQDFVRTLRANGVSRFLIVYKHALRNALNPVLTVIGANFGFLLAGTVVVETVFSLPGVGRLMITSIFNRDYPMIQGGLLLLAIVFVLVNLVTDLLYAAVNPRVRY